MINPLTGNTGFSQTFRFDWIAPLTIRCVLSCRVLCNDSLKVPRAMARVYRQMHNHIQAVARTEQDAWDYVERIPQQ